MAISGLRRRISGSQAARAGLCFAALIVVAEGAVLLLAPSEEGIPPEAVVAERLLRPRGDRARNRLSRGAAPALGGRAGGAGPRHRRARRGPPTWRRDLLARLSSRSVLGTAAAGVVVVVIAEAVAFPMTLAAHERSVDVGLSTQTLGPWLGDQAKGLVIGALVAGAGAAALSALIRRSPRRWWIPGSIVVVGYGAAMSLLAPILIAPRFNDFDELPQSSELRANVVELGDRAGVDVGERLSRRREPPEHRAERIRGGHWAHEAGRALRHIDRRDHGARAGVSGRA